MAIGTLGRRLLVNDHRFALDQSGLRMTFVTANIRVTSLQGEMCSRVMVKRGGHPALHIVAIRTWRLPELHKLACMWLFVTVLTNLRSAFELHFLRSRWYLMTCTALDRPMRPEERELCFRMIKTCDVRPGSQVMTGFAAQWRAVGPAMGHAVLKLAVVGICMAGRAASIFEMEWQDLVGSAGRPHLMTIGARHGGVGSRQRETCVAMLGDCKRGTVKILNRMTTLALVLIRSFRKLSVVGVLMAIRTGGEFHLIDGVFACW